MADKIRGITIEFGADTSQLSSALKQINQEARNTQTQLNDVNRLLKLDPTNVELLNQKQQLLGQQIDNTKNKLQTLQEAEAQLRSSGVDENSQEMMALKREIEASTIQMDKLGDEAQETAKQIDAIKKGDAQDLKTNKQLTKEQKNQTKETKEQNKAAISYGAILAAALKAWKEIGKQVVQAAAYADDIATTSTITGISQSELQALDYMAGLIDTDIGTIQTGLKKIIQAMDQVESGSGDAEDYFDELGVSVYDTEGKLRSSVDVFWDVIEALGQVEDKTERDIIATNLLGKSAMELNPLITTSRERLQELREEAAKFYTLTDEEIGKLNELQDALDRTGKSFEGLWHSISVFFSGTAAKVINWLGEKVQKIRGVFTDYNKIQAGDTGLAGKIVGNYNSPFDSFGKEPTASSKLNDFLTTANMGSAVNAEMLRAERESNVNISISVDDSELSRALRIDLQQEDATEGRKLVR